MAVAVRVHGAFHLLILSRVAQQLHRLPPGAVRVEDPLRPLPRSGVPALPLLGKSDHGVVSRVLCKVRLRETEGYERLRTVTNGYERLRKIDA